MMVGRKKNVIRPSLSQRRRSATVAHSSTPPVSVLRKSRTGAAVNSAADRCHAA
jgi:hypothetical protein